jgi:uncharacterized protein YqjF (DUF2071 family)
VKPPAILSMSWEDLVFLHWPMSADALRPLVPRQLPIDKWDGNAWLSIVAFRMRRFRPLGVPLPGDRLAFGQLNVRTYTTLGGRRGIFLLDTIVGNRFVADGTRVGLSLPYRHAEVSVTSDDRGIRFESRRAAAGARPAAFRASWRPTGPARPPDPGTLDDFLVNRLSLFSGHWSGGIVRTDVEHGPWPLQPATATIDVNTRDAALGLALPDVTPRVAFARRLDVLSRLPVRVARGR